MTIEEKFSRAKTSRKIYIIICSIVLIAGLIGTLVADERMKGGMLAIECMLAFFLVMYGFIFYYGYSKSMKYINKWNMYNLVKDIDIKQVTLKKSKIVCGQYAFYAVRQKLIIPYKPITWIYVTVNKAYGIVEVSRTVNFRCIDGKVFTLQIKENELDILTQIIAKNAPNLILGYGQKQQEVYNNLKNQYLAGEKARKNM